MDRGETSVNMTPINQLPQTEKGFKKLCIIQIVLAFSVLSLAAVLKVMVILYLQGKNHQLQRALDFKKALEEQNKYLHRGISKHNFIYDGHHYYFSCGNMSWYDAEKYCMSQGSHLTSVTSEREQKFIYETSGKATFWIGLNSQKSTEWTWTDGSKFNESQSKKFWAPGQPKNKELDEHCVVFESSNYKYWKHVHCQNHFKFICKKTCKSSRPHNATNAHGL